jgi:hypothetical protein
MSSQSQVITIVIDGKRLLVISLFLAVTLALFSIYVSGFYITQDESLPLHGESIVINGKSASFGGTVTISAGAPFTVNLTVASSEGYFTPYGTYYAESYYYPPGGYYALFPLTSQHHIAIVSVYNNQTYIPSKISILSGTLNTGGKVTYNYTLNPLEPGEYIIKFMVWSDWISQGGVRIADNSGGYVKVVVS